MKVIDNGQQAIRLLLADDHSMLREGLKLLFNLTEDIKVVAEADNGNQVLKLIGQDDFNIVLLDISMPGLSGVNLVTRIRAYAPDVSIIILSMFDDPHIVKRMIEAGVSGYLTKDCDANMLFMAIRKVAKGNHFIEPTLAEPMIFETEKVKVLPHGVLTDREMTIMRLLAKGLGVNDIAVELAISNKTVSSHKMRLMRKMSFKSHADLVRYAMKHGLIE